MKLECDIITNIYRGGKGTCNRKAAHIKGHVKRYLNKGNNIKTLKQFFFPCNGFQKVVVKLCEPHGTVLTTQSNDGILSYSNSAITEAGLLVSKSYKIGNETPITLDDKVVIKLPDLQILEQTAKEVPKFRTKTSMGGLSFSLEGGPKFTKSQLH